MSRPKIVIALMLILAWGLSSALFHPALTMPKSFSQKAGAAQEFTVLLPLVVSNRAPWPDPTPTPSSTPKPTVPPTATPTPTPTWRP